MRRWTASCPRLEFGKFLRFLHLGASRFRWTRWSPSNTRRRSWIMSLEPRLTELLMQWEELRLQGRRVAAEELCSDSTELLDELQRRIRALEALEPVLTVWSSVVDDETATGNPQTDVRSEWPILAGYE